MKDNKHIFKLTDNSKTPLNYLSFYLFLFTLILLPEINLADNTQLQQVLSYPAKRLHNYHFNPDSELLSRVQAPPDFVINLWETCDNRNDYSAYEPTQKEMSIISNSIEKLPSFFKKIFKQRLVGIYFINNLLGSGAADFILDNKYNIYPYMIFNPKVLKTNISTWLTFKENTCFKQDKNIKITIDCGKEYSGFMYILLHEGTHTVDFITNITPYPEPFMTNLPNFKYKNSKFTEKIWNSYNIINDKIKILYQNDITFYGFNHGPKLSITKANKTYNDLINTPFVSLFSTMNWADDLAEYITFYYLTEELKQPYRINLFTKNNKITFEPFKSTLAKSRVRIIKSILNQ